MTNKMIQKAGMVKIVALTIFNGSLRLIEGSQSFLVDFVSFERWRFNCFSLFYSIIFDVVSRYIGPTEARLLAFNLARA